jgi:polyisoprenoid-binding protein YceI
MKHRSFALVLLMLALTLIPLAGASPSPIDKNHSSIAFHVPIMGGMSKVHGKFTDFDIQLEYNDADVSKTSVTATIKIQSIDTGIKDRDDDLRSDSFFDVAKYPDITFKSSHVEKQGDHLVATGTLTMHGVSHEIALPVKSTGSFADPKTGKQVQGFVANITLNRRDYGITWIHSAMANFVGDNVEVELEILTKMH